MRKQTFVMVLLLLSALSAAILPTPASADSSVSNSESITLQVDLTTPGGAYLIGTVVVTRHWQSPANGSAQDDISFAGTVNGKPANLAAQGTETWSGASNATLVVQQITRWQQGLPRPAVPVTLGLSQPGDGLLTLNGVPLAISGRLQPPGSGAAGYIVTAPGSGAQVVNELPRTGTHEGTTTPVGAPVWFFWFLGYLVGGSVLLLLRGLWTGRGRDGLDERKIERP